MIILVYFVGPHRSYLRSRLSVLPEEQATLTRSRNKKRNESVDDLVSRVRTESGFNPTASVESLLDSGKCYNESNINPTWITNFNPFKIAPIHNTNLNSVRAKKTV